MIPHLTYPHCRELLYIEILFLYHDFDFPNIRLEYLDEQGRPMTVKEAFRAQSYKFHGKKPGKNNQEKRQKRLEMDKKRYSTFCYVVTSCRFAFLFFVSCSKWVLHKWTRFHTKLSYKKTGRCGFEQTPKTLLFGYSQTRK